MTWPNSTSGKKRISRKKRCAAPSRRRKRGVRRRVARQVLRILGTRAFPFQFQASRFVIASASEAIHRAAKKVWIASSLSLLADDRHAFAFPRRDAPELCEFTPPCKKRARGMPDARRIRSRVRIDSRKHTSIHARSPKSSGIPTRWFTAYTALFSATGLSCRRRQRNKFHQLDASVEASGPHIFAVRFSAVRQRHFHVHRIPPHVRDDRDTPLKWDGIAMISEVIWVWREEENFCRRGWTANGRFARQAKPGTAVDPAAAPLRPAANYMSSDGPRKITDGLFSNYLSFSLTIDSEGRIRIAFRHRVSKAATI